ncbi:MAG: hypothetical protein ACRD44_00950 [Bryobacteraceae bacterium]
MTAKPFKASSDKSLILMGLSFLPLLRGYVSPHTSLYANKMALQSVDSTAAQHRNQLGHDVKHDTTPLLGKRTYFGNGSRIQNIAPVLLIDSLDLILHGTTSSHEAVGCQDQLVNLVTLESRRLHVIDLRFKVPMGRRSTSHYEKEHLVSFRIRDTFGIFGAVDPLLRHEHRRDRSEQESHRPRPARPMEYIHLNLLSGSACASIEQPPKKKRVGQDFTTFSPQIFLGVARHPSVN